MQNLWDTNIKKWKAIIGILAVVCAGIFYCFYVETKPDITEAWEEEKTDPIAESTVLSEADNYKEEQPKIWVHICGEVNAPGVYEMDQGSRICDLLALADGVTEDGDENALNLARILEDGERVVIPNQFDSQMYYQLEDQDTEKKININTADKEALMSLTGIGESKAEDIIRYRTENGKFQNIEDIMKIPGIKEAAFHKIKDKICTK